MLHGYEYRHFDARKVFNAIVNEGGPDLWEDFLHNNAMEDYATKLYFYDWDCINEFYTPEWASWWEIASKVMNVQPGDTVYLDFN